MTYDSTQDTLEHIARVQTQIGYVVTDLIERGNQHDWSKLQAPEKETFDRVTPLLKTLTYGSDEYKAALVEMGPALQHHYASNSHHPEHWPVPEGEEIDALIADILAFRQAKEVDGELFQRIVGYLEQTLIGMQSRVNGMSLLDIMEMLADHKAASERTKQGSIEQSMEHNQRRFGYSHQLNNILLNTIRELGW